MLGFQSVSSQPISVQATQTQYVFLTDGIASAEVFGIANFHYIAVEGIESKEAFGLAIISLVPITTEVWIVRFR